ncbi:ankyrin repeat domain-containing protein [Legionella waltersii]|uniref:Uncharacterized protein n=1 Tax=Legionella waltersii TaxID=66969 RepID=A0A0W1ANY1_9GAMM|nr:ankyrin repeat domain-containing protein [Legionella waltersii]KTD83046.1 hypothetical protein Lwal_0082 [Legionella waltersii]SNU97497.1 Uncharacterised protein [Legionella waltersii]
MSYNRKKPHLLELLCFIKLGMDISQQWRKGSIALMLAAEYRHSNFVKQLLCAEAKSSESNHNVSNALALAKEYEHSVVVSLLEVS